MDEKYRQYAIKALIEEIKQNPLNEGKNVYDPEHAERLHPTLSKQLRSRNHSLGQHPIFPESDEMHFEEKLMSKRFLETLKNYKRIHEVDNVHPSEVMLQIPTLLDNCIKTEIKHKDKLVELAVKMIREEFDMSEDDVEINAQLTTDITINRVRVNPSPIQISDMQFENHDSIAKANGEVYKRRFVNAMIQGAAMKTNHMFHMLNDELMMLDHTLPNYYSKIMSNAELGPLLFDDTTPLVAGGIVNVQIPNGVGSKPIINAQAMTLPVLIHELVKGVMELLSCHGLPKDKKLAEYILGKADFVAAENWDMRLGPAIWESFVDSIPEDCFNLKHHIFQEFVMLPTDEFNHAMREILANTAEGDKIMQNITAKIKNEMLNDELNDILNADNINDGNSYLSPDDIDGADYGF